MDTLVTSFENTVFDSSLLVAGTDIIEIGIDTVIDNPFLESLPFVKIVVGTGKSIANLVERNLIDQTIHFMIAINNGDVDEEKFSKYREKLANDPKKAEKELGRVMIILNRTIENRKSVILGKLFQAYINERITLDDFYELADALERIFISDVELLQRISQEPINTPDANDEYRGERISAIGLADTHTSFAETTVGNITIGRIIRITAFGKRFLQYGVYPAS